MVVRPERYVTVTIPDEGDTSDAARLNPGEGVTGVLFPAAMDGTGIALLCSIDGENFFAPDDDATTPRTIAEPTDRLATLDPSHYVGFRAVKVKSDSTESTAAVDFTLIIRRLS